MSTFVIAFDESLRPFRSPAPPPPTINVRLRRLRLTLPRDEQTRRSPPVTLSGTNLLRCSHIVPNAFRSGALDIDISPVNDVIAAGGVVAAPASNAGSYNNAVQKVPNDEVTIRFGFGELLLRSPRLRRVG